MGGTSSATGGNANQVSGYEAVKSKEKNSKNNKGANVNTYSSQKTSTQKDKERAEGNVEMGLGKPSKLADYNPEKDDTGVKQSIKDSKKTPVVTPDNDGALDEIAKGNVPGAVKRIAKAAVGPKVGEPLAKTAPTEAEVSQSETANADAQALKVKKRGRSRSIMTSAKGVTKTSSDYSLGRPSLLGRV